MPPLTPVAPNRLVLVGAATGGGMLLALLLAFLREAMDNTVRGQDALEREFGLTFLGLIPRIRPSVARVSSPRGPARGEAWSADTYAHDYPKSAIAESCRAIRTNLAFVLADGGLDTLLVTSPGPREGKTTTCVNIASVMAQAGGRVLLVDADMRRPRVHTAVGVQNDVGLTSVLLDGLSVGEAVQPSRIPNLDVLTSGPVPPNPAELLGSKAFRELLEELRGRYDRVILDSPPVAPVTDAAVAATQVSGVVVVVRANATRKELLGRAIETLQGVGANLVGAVLNDLDLSRRRAGGSYYYYYRQYSGYYGPGADES
jgi:capsular exopolysaccharide synthesis family protein